MDVHTSGYKGNEATASYRFGDNLRLGVGAIHLDSEIRDAAPESADLIGNTPSQGGNFSKKGSICDRRSVLRMTTSPVALV